jgi:hypothetical protein
MIPLERIENATRSAEYQRYATQAGEALAKAVLSYDQTAKARALKEYREIIAKQAALVQDPWYDRERYSAEAADERAAERAEERRAQRDEP